MSFASLVWKGFEVARKRVYRLGLTGAPGAGKSETLAAFRECGVPALQADRVARSLLSDASVRRRIRRAFGPGVLDARGRVVRARLARAAFAGRRTQERLNRILHPAVRRRIRAWYGELSRRHPAPSLGVVEVPLLFERGFHRFFDGTLSVSSPAALRRARLRRRGWSSAEIRRREALQLPAREKNRRADFVLQNDGSRARLRRAVRRFLSDFRGRKA